MLCARPLGDVPWLRLPLCVLVGDIPGPDESGSTVDRGPDSVRKSPLFPAHKDIGCRRSLLFPSGGDSHSSSLSQPSGSSDVVDKGRTTSPPPSEYD